MPFTQNASGTAHKLIHRFGGSCDDLPRPLAECRSNGQIIPRHERPARLPVPHRRRGHRGCARHHAVQPRRLSHARRQGRRALRRQGAQPEEAGHRLYPGRPAGRTAAADGERDRLDGGDHHPHRGRGAAARGQPDQAPEAALQHRAARRQVVPVADADRGPSVPADRQASRRAGAQGQLLGAVRVRLGGEPDGHRDAARVPAALLRRHGVRQPHPPLPAVSDPPLLGAVRRSGSARRTTAAWSARRRRSSPASRPPCSRSLPPRWSRPPERWNSSTPRRCATASAR